MPIRDWEEAVMGPETRYAKSGDVHIAYQVVGDGQIDLVLVPGFVSHVECIWEEPSYARFLERMASFSRVILFDKRGTGMSDPVPIRELPTLEQRMDDVRAVMDAAGSQRAALFGWSEGGAMSVPFAATHPERTSALVLFGTTAKIIAEPGYPGVPRGVFERLLEVVEEDWHQGVLLFAFAPTAADDPRFSEWWARWQRLGASPGAAFTVLEMESDAREILPSVNVPTLILHRTGDAVVLVEQARYMAGRIPGAKLVELSGVDHVYWMGDQEDVLGEIEEFLTGIRHAPDSDRVLATVLFTDIVRSTELAARMGDRSWRDLLDHHNLLVRRQLERFRGREIDTAGDGFFASFDGPARAIQCACAIRDAGRALGLQIRAGIHTGECELLGGKLTGLSVHLGARIASRSESGEVMVSRTVKDLVAGSGLVFDDRGEHELKGIPGTWRLFSVVA